MPTSFYLIVSGPSSRPNYLTVDGEWSTDPKQPLCCFASLDEALTLCATLPNSRPVPLSYTPPRLHANKPTSPSFALVRG